LFHAAEGAIERAICGQQFPVCNGAKSLGELISVKLFDSGSREASGGLADRTFERNETTWFSAHARL
jgi:hypothetical protein